MNREQAEVLGRQALAAGWVLTDGELRRWSGDTDWSVRIDSTKHFNPDTRRQLEARQAWPDFRDAATEGILAGQVRERWRNDWLSPVWMGRRWTLPDGFGGSLGKGPTRVHCWIAALEAAPDE